MKWQPTASLDAIKARAYLYQQIRDFFKKRNILEVETPLLCHAATLDPHLHAIPALYSQISQNQPYQSNQLKYLQTSPEFAMKRLLAASNHCIYQICKAFRNGEQGRIHNPEFSILEWYRIGFNHHQLMDEMDEFLITILECKKSKRITYRDLFLEKINLDPFTANINELKNCATQNNIDLNFYVNENLKDELTPNFFQNDLTQDDWLNLLLTHIIEPTLGFAEPTIVYDFPASQAALSKIRKTSEDDEYAERFEVYMNGMELANGYHELTDSTIQLNRFKNDIKIRSLLNHSEIPIDIHLISALEHGLPQCAGVALGIDRLLMLKLGTNNIQDVLTFTIENA